MRNDGSTSEGHQRRAEHAAAHPAEVDRELRGPRPRCELCERDALGVVLFAEPALLLDEVALHGYGERDGAAEAEGSEPHEVRDELAERAAHKGI